MTNDGVFIVSRAVYADARGRILLAGPNNKIPSDAKTLIVGAGGQLSIALARRYGLLEIDGAGELGRARSSDTVTAIGAVAPASRDDSIAVVQDAGRVGTATNADTTVPMGGQS